MRSVCKYWGTTDRPLIWKISNGDVSAMGHPIHFVFGSRAGEGFSRSPVGWSNDAISGSIKSKMAAGIQSFRHSARSVFWPTPGLPPLQLGPKPLVKDNYKNITSRPVWMGLYPISVPHSVPAASGLRRRPMLFLTNRTAAYLIASPLPATVRCNKLRS